MAELIGQKLGQYEIVAMLGKGGMASVYRARQQTIKREVALKVIRPKGAESEEYLKRFERETATTGLLSHTHIVKVFDYGIQDPYVYLVMELLTGGSVEDLMEKGPIPLDRIAQILEDVGSALDYAHSKGVVHRDLKPGNIMFNEAGEAFLTDFGIVKSTLETSALTEQGSIVGTPAYIAPELWRGQDVSPLADVYSLGVLTFEMATGKPAFTGETIYSMMKQHVSEPIPSILSALPSLPPTLERVISKALAKNPALRYQKAGDLAAAFAEAISQPASGAAKRKDAGAKEEDSTLRLGSSPVKDAKKKGRERAVDETARPASQPTRGPGPTIETGPGDPSLTRPLPAVQDDVKALEDEEPLPTSRTPSLPSTPSDAVATSRQPALLEPAAPKKRSDTVLVVLIGIGLIAVLAVIILVLFSPRADDVNATATSQASQTAGAGVALAAPTNTVAVVLTVILTSTPSATVTVPNTPTTENTATSTATSTVAPSATSTIAPTNTSTITATSTNTVANTATNTTVPTQTAAPTQAPTATRQPTKQSTESPTNTPIPPTETPVPPTATTIPETRAIELYEAGQLVYGQESGTLVHTDEEQPVMFQSGKVLADFALDVQFTNPYGTDKGKWDYGVIFRQVLYDQYRLIIASSGNYALALGKAGIAGRTDLTVVNRGTLTTDIFKTGSGDTNALRLIVKGGEAFLFVNEQFVTALDVSGRLDGGSVSIATGIQGKEYQVKDAKTTFTDFTLFELK